MRSKIDYLTSPDTQIATARDLGFFPVVKAELPRDLEPAVKLGAAAIEKMQSAKDALPVLLPIGLGEVCGERPQEELNLWEVAIFRDPAGPVYPQNFW